MREQSLRAMNTDIRLLVVGEDGHTPECLRRAAGQFTVYERALSRFLPDSDLSALNRSAAQWTPVPPLLFEALATAATLSALTGGLYNPGVLPALEAAGYDRSFERLVQPQPGDHAAQAAAFPDTPRSEPPPPRPFELDHERRAVRLLPGVRLDLGGIGKGLAVDAAAAELAGQAGYLIDAGGDIRVGGESPDGGPWGIAVQDPRKLDEDLAVLAIESGAVATSSVGRRRWVQQGAVYHHLIDPRTGQSAASDVLAATVLASRCAVAEVFAKAVVIAGATDGFALLQQRGLAGLVVDPNGCLRANPAMQPFLPAAAG